MQNEIHMLVGFPIKDCSENLIKIFEYTTTIFSTPLPLLSLSIPYHSYNSLLLSSLTVSKPLLPTFCPLTKPTFIPYLLSLYHLTPHHLLSNINFLGQTIPLPPAISTPISFLLFIFIPLLSQSHCIPSKIFFITLSLLISPPLPLTPVLLPYHKLTLYAPLISSPLYPFPLKVPSLNHCT